jgi:hypothetical protein
MPRARRNQKFSPEEDQHIILLKEVHNLEWKEIANYFPGRTYGTIQCHYCTKLKKREWTVEAVYMYSLQDEHGSRPCSLQDDELQMAIQQYEREKWSIIAKKVGRGFTSTDCE